MDDKTIRKLAKALAEELRRNPIPVITAAELEAKQVKEERDRHRAAMEWDAKLESRRIVRELNRKTTA